MSTRGTRPRAIAIKKLFHGGFCRSCPCDQDFFGHAKATRKILPFPSIGEIDVEVQLVFVFLLLVQFATPREDLFMGPCRIYRKVRT